MQKINRLSKGVALILTIAISVLLVILVGAFYYSVMGRRHLSQKRTAQTGAYYKAEAGALDAMARLRIGRADPTATDAIDPTDPGNNSMDSYCLDIDLTPPGLEPGGGSCPNGNPNWGDWDVRVEVGSQNSGLNEIITSANY